MVTSKRVLVSVKNSLLAATFEEQISLIETENGIFIDRDPEIFRYLINYLRNERKQKIEFDSKEKKSLFEAELEYWQIENETLLGSSNMSYDSLIKS